MTEDAIRPSVLTEDQKLAMLAVVIRNPIAFQAASDRLPVEAIETFSDGLAVVWRVVRKFHAKYAELPDKAQIRAEVAKLAANNPMLLPEESQDEVDDFLDYAFDSERIGEKAHRSNSHARVAMTTCVDLLRELSAMKLREDLIRDGTIAPDLPTVLAKAQLAMQSASAITTPDAGEVFQAGWDEEAPLVLFPTGLKMLDNMLGGGWAAGEVVEFMAPFGVCKTTLAVQAAAEMVLSCVKVHALESAAYAARKKKGKKCKSPKRPVVFLISTEMGIVEFRYRILSYLSRIPRKRLQTIGKLGNLCKEPEPAATPDTEYEKAEFSNPDEVFRCEYDRATSNIEIINRFLIFLNATASNVEFPTIGAGGVQDFSVWIRNICLARRDIRPFFVSLDHASALALRMVELNDSLSYNDEKDILRAIPLHCGDFLAKRYNVPVLLIHQLSGEANDRPATATIRYTDAAGCKSFGMYADFVIVCGRAFGDANFRTTVWRCDKHRREPPSTEAIVQVDGRFARLIDRSDTHVANAARYVIVSKAEFAQEQATKQQKFALSKAHNGGVAPMVGKDG